MQTAFSTHHVASSSLKLQSHVKRVLHLHVYAMKICIYLLLIVIKPVKAQPHSMTVEKFDLKL